MRGQHEGDRELLDVARSSYRGHAVAHLARGVGPAEDRDRLLVVGAEYSLDTGVVDFFDGVPG